MNKLKINLSQNQHLNQIHLEGGVRKGRRERKKLMLKIILIYYSRPIQLKRIYKRNQAGLFFTGGNTVK